MKKTQPSLVKATEEYSLENLMVLEKWNAEREAALEAERDAKIAPDVRAHRAERERFKRWKELVGEVMRDRRHAEQRARDKTIISGDPGNQWTAS